MRYRIGCSLRLSVLYCALIVLGVLCGYAHAKGIPQPVGYVNDFAHILKPQTVKRLKRIVMELKQKTGVEFVIVTIKGAGGDDIFDYSMRLFQKWGIGEKGKDNGVLFLVDIGDRKLRINTGYGMEGILPDGLLGRIRDRYILPYFRKGDYDKGILNGVMAIANIIAKAYHVRLNGNIKAENPAKVHGWKVNYVDIVLLIGLLFFTTPFFLPLIFGASRGSYRSDWDDPFGGGFGSGGLGGGFGGFGGGSSGGGGVGGSW